MGEWIAKRGEVRGEGRNGSGKVTGSDKYNKWKVESGQADAGRRIPYTGDGGRCESVGWGHCEHCGLASTHSVHILLHIKRLPNKEMRVGPDSGKSCLADGGQEVFATSL